MSARPLDTVPRRALWAVAALAAGVHAGPALAELEQGECALEKQADVPVEMRDGTILMADVYRPQEEGTYPVLLQL